MRKVTPMGPAVPAAAEQLPPSVAAALAAAQAADPTKQQLQSAFLTMYSNPEQKVRSLR